MTRQRILAATRPMEGGGELVVGVLVRRDEPAVYEFEYLDGIEHHPDFVPLAGLPDVGRRYVSPTLFPTFANRLMSPARPDYQRYVEDLGLTVDADPFDVLERSGGRRATDSVGLRAPT